MSTIELISPVDERVYATRERTSDEAFAAQIDAARRAQRDWAAVAISERAEACGRYVDAVLAMEAELVPELAWQMGRPVRFGAGELAGFAERGRHMIDLAPEALAPVVASERAGFDRWVARDPLGVVLVIAPWNYPLLTAVNSIVPALMAGNAVVLKHASQTLLVGERLAQAAEAAGLPDGLFANPILGHGQVSDALSRGQFDRVNFTGSVEAGRSIERAAAGTFTDVGLELGGKDPAYVREDADIAFAAENVADGAFFNSGQSCCGIERVYVARSRFDEFVDAVAAVADGYALGSPVEPETTMGPMVNGRAADEVRGQIAAALAAGASVANDRGRHTAAGEAGSPYHEPVVLVGVSHDMEVMREESFGPVVGIMPVDDDDAAVALMNDSPYGLSASIWTADADAARALGARIETGTVFMNRADYLDPELAWTGVKDTGRGATLSRLGYELLTRPKSYHLRLGQPD